MLKQKLQQEYKEVFDCNNHLRCMDGDPMKIHLQKGAAPHAIHEARTIPFAFQEETKKYLQDIKVYRLGGETDSAIRWRKRTSCDVGERPEEAGC